MPSIATATRSLSEAKSNMPSPAANDNEPELEKTTTADAARLKEAFKVKMHGGPSEDTSVPPPQLCPKLRLRKKSTL